MSKYVLFCVGLISAIVSANASGSDWPQWMGPHRDGVWQETGLIESFPETGPTIKWRVPIAGGYSGPAVANGRVFVTDYVRSQGEAVNDPGKRAVLQGEERILCLAAATGDLLWKHSWDCPYEISYPAGPRATPTVVGDRVYVLGAEGNLLALDANNGSVIWSRVLKQDYQMEVPIWGFSGHPLVDGDKLICLVGGEGSVCVAFDRHTGKELWRALSAREPGYAPPTMIEAGGRRQLIIWHAEAVNSLNPETGEVYWSHRLEPQYGMAIMAPRQSGNLLFASGIGDTAAVYQLDSSVPKADLVWKGTAKTAVYCANSTPVIVDNVVYGADCRSGGLRAVDLKTGERLWENFRPTTGDRRGGHGTAFLVKQGDRFILFSETGDLIFARLSRDGYTEVSRAHVIEPTGECFGRNVVWSHPAFANRCAFVRNDRELVCVSLAADAPAEK